MKQRFFSQTMLHLPAMLQLHRWLTVTATVLAVLFAGVRHAAAEPDPGTPELQAQGAIAAGDRQSLPLIHAPDANARGFNGKGTSIAVIDTGVDYRRPAFGPCTAPAKPAKTCRVSAAGVVGQGDGRLDSNGHGTNVSGIALSVAPDTRLIVINVFNGEQTSTGRVLAALDWVMKNRAKYNIVAVNMSLGSTSWNTRACTASPYASVFSDLRAVGILPIVSAGNSAANSGRFTNGVAEPACVPGAVSVGATYDSNVGARVFDGECADRATRADQVTCWGQTGPTLGLYAPGSRIEAAGYTFEGTSQAAPHVTGAVAALKSKCKNATPDQVEKALVSSGPRITDPRNGLTRVRLDVLAAGQALESQGLCR